MRPLADVVPITARPVPVALPVPIAPAIAEPMPGGNLVPLSREWDQLVTGLTGLTQDVLALARNCALEAREPGDGAAVVAIWELVVAPGSDILVKDLAVRALEAAVSAQAGAAVKLKFVNRALLGETPRMAADRRTKERLAHADQVIRGDDNVHDMITLFEARIVPGSIKPAN